MLFTVRNYKILPIIPTTEAADTATDLDNLIVRQGETKNSYQKFYGDDKRCFATMDNLKTFGEEVIVADRTKIKAKLRDRGKRCGRH